MTPRPLGLERLSRKVGPEIDGDPGATLDDLREAVTTLEDIERIARRVLGGAHPVTGYMEGDLQKARAVLDAREGDVESAVESVRAAVEAMAPGDA